MKPNMTRRGSVASLLAVLLSVIAVPALADGVLMPVPPPNPPQPVKYLNVKYHHVTIDVKDQVLTCSIDQVFHNPNPYQIEGEYLFPVPAGATVSKFNMEVDGQPLAGRMLPRDEARSIYEGIVRSMRDPALLEYVGRDTFRARVFPIPANGDKRITIRYEQVVPMDNGVATVLYPLNTEKFSYAPLEEVSVAATIESSAPIASVYSPSHPIDVTRVSNRKVIAGWEERNVKPETDFLLYYTVSQKDLGVSVISTWPAGEEGGYFLLLAAPQYEADPSARIPKDVVFVLDTSGSMQTDRKIDQAREALRFCVSALNEDDRLNVVRFSTGVESLAETVRPVAEARSDALEFVKGLEARGGTNLEGALTTALGSFEVSSRPRILVLLSDGNPTVGQTNLEELQKLAKAANKVGARAFVFGVGYDVNTHFLDQLAEDNGGLSQYVRPSESIEQPVSTFFSKLSRPVLADIALDFGGVKTVDVYPQTLPDLFAGSQLLVVGRYTGAGSATVTVSGSAGDAKYADEFPVHFADGPESEFVPRLWAARKIGFLLDQIRLHGGERELVDEVVALSMKFGIMTEYTSFLVEEGARVVSAGAQFGGGGYGGRGGMPGAKGESGPMGPVGMGAAGGMAMDQMRRANEATAGSWAVSQQQNAQSLRYSEQAPNNRYRDEQGQEQQIAGVKYIAGRAFYFRNGRWEDANYREGLKLAQVQNYSNAQFALAAAAPILNQYMSLGDRVVITVDGHALEIGPEGSADLTDAEIEALLGALKGQS